MQRSPISLEKSEPTQRMTYPINSQNIEIYPENNRTDELTNDVEQRSNDGSDLNIDLSSVFYLFKTSVKLLVLGVLVFYFTKIIISLPNWLVFS